MVRPKVEKAPLVGGTLREETRRALHVRQKNSSIYLMMMTARLQTIGYAACVDRETRGNAQVKYHAILHLAIV